VAEAELEAGGESEESPEPPRAVTIHVPGEDLGREGAVEPVEEAPAEIEVADEPTSAEAEEAPKPKKKTRRGSRGGRNRKKKPATASQNGAEAAAELEEEAQEAEPEPASDPEPASADGNFEYVPMAEWLDEIDSGR
jgi:hypothetical protein